MAQVVWDTTFDVTAVWRDYVAADQQTCAGWGGFLTENQYGWGYWAHGAVGDQLWTVYPYGDRTGATTAGVGTKDPQAVPTPQHSTGGNIDVNSYKVWLNGTLIVNNGVPITGVTLVTSSSTGSTYRVSTTLANKYNATNPSANNGGWNEMKASIADLSARRTTIRTRFPVVGPGVKKNLALSALRDFSHLAQGDCAAFGAFQCGGATLAFPIPGFVTRDRDRSLHLVYRSASQRAPTALPQRLIVDRLQLAPDSMHLTAKDLNGIPVGRTMRYMGARAAPGVTIVASTDTLRQNAAEDRLIGAELSAPATGNEAIRVVNVQVRSFYADSIRDTLVSREVVQQYLSDTTATRFGMGWQLAELSRLVFGQTFQGAPAAIWLFGDGSYTIFRQVGGVWISPVGETAKLLDSTTTAGLAARWVASLANGATVGYKANGWQQYTADLAGNKTVYVYGATDNRLLTITDPSGLRYGFQYNAAGAPGQAGEVWMRASATDSVRVVTLAYDANKRLRTIRVWRSETQYDSTTFGYLANTSYGAYVDTIFDPRHKTAAPIFTTLAYDSLFAVATNVVRPPPNQGPAAQAQLQDQWRRALPRAGRGVAPQDPGERTVSTNLLYGRFAGFAGASVDFTLDPFGGPTYVRENIAGGDTRRIVRDSLGRVLRVTSLPDSAALRDSVVYRYDAFNRVDRVISNTALYPLTTVTLDTLVFTYDSVSLAGGVRCHRLRTTRDAAGGISKALYDSTGAGVRPCLPIRMIGLANDTTRFAYGALVTGDAAGVRPVLVTDPNGLANSVQYDPITWNSAVHVRQGDMATSRLFFDAYGRPDHAIDPANTRTDFRYDRSGRPLRSKTGEMAPTAPTVATFYNAADLVDSVRVYSSPDGVDGDTAPPVRRTRYYYNRLGWLDSTITPGGRRLSFGPQRDGYGNPVWEYPGNHTYVARIFDWAGRLVQEDVSAVDPNALPPVPGAEVFAPAFDDSVYKSFGLNVTTRTLSPGQVHGFGYDTKGRLAWTSSREPGQTDSTIARHMGYSRVGALIADTTTFLGGAQVVRRFEYNRRGQRTLVADTAFVAGTGSFSGEVSGMIRYHYSTVTARLDSMVGTSGTQRVGRVRWRYDRGGRDSLRIVRLGSGTGYSADSLVTTFTYDAAGHRSRLLTKRGTTTWYEFNATAPGAFSVVDDILSYSSMEPIPFVGARSYSRSYGYATDGTRRLTSSGKNEQAGPLATYAWLYDVFANRTRETVTMPVSQSCIQNTTGVFSFNADDQLTRQVYAGCNWEKDFWNDATGNRLGQTDIQQGMYVGPQALMAYTAKGELIFSMTPTVRAGDYNFNWHWYGADRRRVISVKRTGTTFVPNSPPSPTSGVWSYYLYDGSDVALVLKGGSGSWWIEQRYLAGGIDAPLVDRFAIVGGNAQNLALVNDLQGTTVAALKNDWTQETQATYYQRNAYGHLEEGNSSGSNVNTQTAFSGASTPNQGGGFAYMRNRWYDPQTGRFLTQDPIGLAGGSNLYEYAGSNPVSFADPFGLCAVAGDDIYYDARGKEICREPNDLDHDRFYVVDDRGQVQEWKFTLDPLSVEARAPDDRDGWQKLGDFAAGLGDLPFGITDWLRAAIPGGCRQDCVRYDSREYFAGTVASVVTQGGLGELAALKGMSKASVFTRGTGAWNKGWTRIGWGWHKGNIFRIGIGGRGQPTWWPRSRTIHLDLFR